MRINVYAEEVTTETELVTKTAEQAEGNDPVTFYGLRLFLASPDVLHHSPGDDDRSAITIFVPWTKAGGHNFPIVRAALESLLDTLALAEVADADRDG